MKKYQVVRKDTFIEKIGNIKCYNKLQDFGKLTLVMDLRKNPLYKKDHLRTSINLPFEIPKDFKDFDLDKSFGKDEPSKKKFTSRGIYNRFILYGDQKKSEKLANLLLEDYKKRFKEIFVLEDYISFKKRYPFLITTEKTKAMGYEFPSEICNNFLYLGNVYHAKNKTILDSLKITHIVNAAVELGNYFEDTYEYCKIEGIEDIKTANLSDLLDPVLPFLKDAEEKKGRVFVHCNMGISRSSSICIGYLMSKFKYSYEKSFNQVKDARSIIRPNEGFVKQLNEYF